MFKNKFGYFVFAPDKNGSGNGENQDDQDGAGDNGESSADSKKTDDSHMIPKSRLDAEIARRKEFEKKFKASEKALKDAQTARMEENQEYKDLYEKAKSELSELKPKADQVESWKETMESLLEAQIEEIPEDLRGLIPREELTVKQTLDWIAKNKQLLLKPVGPDLNAGSQGSKTPGESTQTRELSNDEKLVARRFGFTDKEYLESLNEDIPEQNQNDAQ